jgi:hypothetical protein
MLDRGDKDAITLLFATVLNKGSMKVEQKRKEIKKAGLQVFLSKRASPSAKYFCSARRSFVKKTPKIPASTHQFPTFQ